MQEAPMGDTRFALPHWCEGMLLVEGLENGDLLSGWWAKEWGHFRGPTLWWRTSGRFGGDAENDLLGHLTLAHSQESRQAVTTSTAVQEWPAGDPWRRSGRAGWVACRPVAWAGWRGWRGWQSLTLTLSSTDGCCLVDTAVRHSATYDWLATLVCLVKPTSGPLSGPLRCPGVPTS